MEDQRPDAPELELTAQPADGEDALQLSPTDAPGPAVSLGDAFSIKVHKTETPPLRPAKAVTAEANNSVVAALMGRPIGMAKPAQPPAVAPPAPKPVAVEAIAEAIVEPAVEPPVARPVQPVAITAQNTDNDPDSLSRYAGGGLGRGSSTDKTLSMAAADPLPNPPPEYRERGPDTASVVLPTAVAAALPTVPLPSQPASEAQMPPATPPPRRAIPVAPVWPAEPATLPRAQTPAFRAPKPQTSKPQSSKPASVPTPPPHLYVSAAPRTARPASPVGDAALKLLPSPAKQPSPLEPAVPYEPAGPSGAWWTIPLTFVGIAIVACAMLIPAADENRRDNYELAKIERDVDYFERQSGVNQDFLKRINTDATLAERLAMRQLHQTRQGVKIAPMSGKPDHFGASPYAMTRLDPPAPLPPYQPVPGRLTEWFLGGQQPQQMAALGLLVAGAGVCVGGLRKRV